MFETHSEGGSRWAPGASHDSLDHPPLAPLRILLGRGVANHPGFAELVARSRVERPVQVGIHHLSRASSDSGCVTEYVPEGKTRSPDGYVDECLRAAIAWRADVFWPGRELEAFATRRGEFVTAGVVLMSCGSPPAIALANDKLAFIAALREAGLPVPTTLRFNDAAGFEDAFERIAGTGETVCFKPRHGIYGRGFRVVREGLDLFDELLEDPSYRIDRDDARRRFRSRNHFRDMIAMVWLSGTEWSVDCFASRDGLTFRGIARQKRLGTGASSQTLTLRHETIELSRQVSRAIGLRGLFNCQFKYHRGEPFVLEANPRPAGGVGVTVHAGLNLAELALRDALSLSLLDSSSSTAETFHATQSSAWVIRPAEVSREEPACDPVPSDEAGDVSPPQQLREELPGSHVVVRRLAGPWPVQRLLGLASRVNSARSVLLVSRVLGKHVPVTPSRAAATHRDLAAMIPREAVGPVLFVGMAETATGLGWGVYEQWKARTGREDAVYIHTTRYVDRQHRWLTFHEVHSHAPVQAILSPEDPAAPEAFRAAKTLVVVDDELTSGRTAQALAHELQTAAVPIIDRIAIGLVDATSPAARSDGAPLSGWLVSALCQVALEVASSGGVHALTVARQGLTTLPAGVGGLGWGRLGALAAPKLPEYVVPSVMERLAGLGQVTLVASGESMHPAFVLGCELERAGCAVLLQSTSRSPIALGGAIRASLQCVDPLGSCVPFYLHNPPSGAGCVVLFERGGTRAAALLAERLHADTLEVWDA